VIGPTGLPEERQPLSGGCRAKGGIVDTLVTTANSGQTPEALLLHLTRLRSQAVAGARQGALAPALKRRRSETWLRPPVSSVNRLFRQLAGRVNGWRDSI
jgi:hypothetical protein